VGFFKNLSDVDVTSLIFAALNRWSKTPLASLAFAAQSTPGVGLRESHVRRSMDQEYNLILFE